MNQFLERKQNISTSILIEIESRVGSRNRYKFEGNFGAASSVNWNWRVTRSDWSCYTCFVEFCTDSINYMHLYTFTCTSFLNAYAAKTVEKTTQ
jgi:hypothetical protein